MALKKLTSYLEKNPEIRIAIVYGSFSEGKQKKESDLDLAIACEKAMSAEEKVGLLNEISVLMGREVDLLDLHQATGTVFKEAMTKGKILVKKTRTYMPGS